VTSHRGWMVRARCAAAFVGATALIGVAVPTAHAADDQGAPQYYNSGLAPTPYMGWNTYYGLGAPTEAQVKSVADYLVSSGLRDSGYNIVWLDGGWQADNPRDSQGRLVANPDRFPSGIPSLVTYLHQRGLKAGIYTDAGTYDGGKSCGLGSRGHYTEDAQQFADWKIDAIKVDFLCGVSEKLDPGPAFKEFSDAVAKTGRPMLLNLCKPAHRRLGAAAHSRAGRAQRVHLRADHGGLVAHRHRHRLGISHGRRVAQHPACRRRQRLASGGAGARTLQRSRLPDTHAQALGRHV